MKDICCKLKEHQLTVLSHILGNLFIFLMHYLIKTILEVTNLRILLKFNKKLYCSYFGLVKSPFIYTEVRIPFLAMAVER